jgi:predicted acetyltransferase
MDVDVRKLRPEEAQAFVQSVAVPFLSPTSDDPESFAEEEDRIARTETDRAWVAEEAGRFVGNSCIHTMDLTVPGAAGDDCPVTAMAGISAVGVHPTHRRRGLLRQLMAAMLEDARAQGEAVAGLIASESIIYGRFGFGLATDMAELTINSRESAFTGPVPEVPIHLLDRDEAAKVLPDLYDRQRRSRPGEVSRSDHVWKAIIADRPNRRGGGGGVFFAACDRGYLAYRAHDANILRADLASVVVDELRGVDPATEAALWRFVLDLDLVGQVTVRRRPLDDPVRWRLQDPRQLQVAAVEDRLYLRILDVPKALEARHYRRAGRVVMDLVGPSVDEGPADPAPGRWVLEADAGTAACRRARPGEDADVRMEVTDLGSLYLGGYPASLLAGAGRIEELRPRRLELLDSLFGTSPAPLTGTGF